MLGKIINARNREPLSPSQIQHGMIDTERFEQNKQILSEYEKEVDDLSISSQKYRKYTGLQVESIQRIWSLLERCTTAKCTENIQEDVKKMVEAMRVIHKKMHTFATAVVPQVFDGLIELLNNDLTCAKRKSKVCENALERCNKFINKLENQQHASKKAEDNITLFARQQSVQSAFHEYSVSERDFMNSMWEFKANRSIGVINAMSNYAIGEHINATELCALLETTQTNVTHIASAITSTEETIQQNKLQQEEELTSLRSKNPVDRGGIMNPAVFAEAQKLFIDPPSPVTLPGERVGLDVKLVINMTEEKYTAGVLFMTNFRVIFRPYRMKAESGHNPITDKSDTTSHLPSTNSSSDKKIGYSCIFTSKLHCSSLS